MREIQREGEREWGGEITCIIHGVGEGIVSTWAQAETCDCVTVTSH